MKIGRYQLIFMLNLIVTIYYRKQN